MFKKPEQLFRKIKTEYNRRSLQFLLAISFTVVSVFVTVGISAAVSQRFEKNSEKMQIDSNKMTLDQMSLNLDNYLHSMMSISNTMYYSIIKNEDFNENNLEEINKQMKLLYDANATSLVSVSIFTEDGELVAAQPLSRQKEGVDPAEESWFKKALEQTENVHFSEPHIENTFQSSDNVYHWVVSLSRYVEMTRDGESTYGVVLVNMNFTGIENICKGVDSKESGYTYIIDRDGELIYHPAQQLIYGGLIRENNKAAASYPEGAGTEKFQGEKRQITVKTVGYTGWKIVRVSPIADLTKGYAESGSFIWIIALVGIIILILANNRISYWVTNPIKRLEKSVRKLEETNLSTPVFIGGTYEIRHLGRTLQSMADSMRRLMDDIVKEQEGKRKSEMSALQSQINPHFLYNTLDSIVWMIENERYEGAITMVTVLAQFFRLSISKGKNIITVEQELKHAENYLIIQKIRYQNKFDYKIELDPDAASCATIKLIVQPLIENALYHGMEYMDGDGEITIHAYREGGLLFIDVSDNGPGMTKEQVQELTGGRRKSGRSKGSGIGFYNVLERIRLYFGAEYGMEVESEPDEGTRIRIRIPAKSMSEMEIEGGEDRP